MSQPNEPRGGERGTLSRLEQPAGRRDFLKWSGAGVLGTVVLGACTDDTDVRSITEVITPRGADRIPLLKIHSVEARHASKVRRLAASPAVQGWIPFSQPNAPAAIAPVYMGEAETVQAGVNVVSVVSGLGVTEEDVTEAFDEPLTRAQVLAIVDAFIVGDVDGDGTEA